MLELSYWFHKKVVRIPDTVRYNVDSNATLYDISDHKVSIFPYKHFVYKSILRIVLQIHPK